MEDDWVMLISDSFAKANFEKTKAIKNPKYIPRVGEKIDFGYIPVPTVEIIGYDFSNKVIMISCK